MEIAKCDSHKAAQGPQERTEPSGGSYNARINLQKFNVNATRQRSRLLMLPVAVAAAAATANRIKFFFSCFWLSSLTAFIFGFEAARCLLWLLVIVAHLSGQFEVQ